MSAEQLAELKECARKNNIPVMKDEAARFICGFIQRNNVQSVLEIGTATGCSAIQFASEKPDVHITTVEIDAGRAAQAVQNIRNAQLADRIHVIHSDALSFCTDSLFDLIFIDAAKAQYEKFFERFKRNLKPDGAIISDNLFFHGIVESQQLTRSRSTRMLAKKLKNYAAFLQESTEFSTEFVAAGDGLAVSRRKENFSHCIVKQNRMQKTESFQIFRIDSGRALKLFGCHIPREAVMQEFRNTLCVCRLGISVPKAIETAALQGRFGIVFRTPGEKTLLDALCEGADIRFLTRKYAQLHKAMLCRAPQQAENYKEQLVRAAGGHAKEHSAVIRKIKHLPDGNCLCHGNLHPENVWIQADGSLAACGFMNLCRGPKEYDVAKAYFATAQTGSEQAVRLAQSYLKESGIPHEKIAAYLEVLCECCKP